MDTIQEIKARLPIEELVAQYCQIQKKGRGFMALCPFHNDTKPSLNISPDKGIAYCFACQTGGDIFSFYQAIEGVDFPQALKDLAEKAGVALPKERMAAAGPKKNEKDRMRDCLQEAAEFYRGRLEESETARNHLLERGVQADLAEQFEIGCAPDSFDATYTHLLKKGFSRQEILQTGLGVQKELHAEKIYDRFRNRLMFPIFDYRGDIIGFGGRTLGQDDAKYINSPDGPLYNKSEALFGYFQAKDALRETGVAILVEGYFDVLAFHRLGIRNVVAVSGTALTQQHLRILKRTVGTILLCLDNDRAGKEAAERAFMLACEQEIACKMLTLPAGKDPDECVRKEPDALRQEIISGGRPYFLAFLDALNATDLDAREKLKRILPLLRCIRSSVEKLTYIRAVAQALHTTETAVTDDLGSIRQENVPVAGQATARMTPTFSTMEILLGLLQTFPEQQRMIERIIEPTEEAEKELYTAVKDSYTFGTMGESSRPDLSVKCRERLSILHLYCEEHFGSWSPASAEREIRKMCRNVNHSLLLQKQRSLIDDIRTARLSGKHGVEEQLLTQYQETLKLAKMTN